MFTEKNGNIKYGKWQNGEFKSWLDKNNFEEELTLLIENT